MEGKVKQVEVMEEIKTHIILRSKMYIHGNTKMK